MEKSILAILALLVGLVAASTTETDSVAGLEGLIELAIDNNPELQALRADYEASGARISWLGNIPDPVIGVEFSDVMTMYSVNQQVPFPTKLSKRRELAQDEAAYHFFQYLDKEHDITLLVKKIYTEFLLLHAKIRATERSIAFMEQIHNISQQKYSIDEAKQAEVLMAQVQLAKDENRLVLLRDDLAVARAYLNSILNRDLESTLPLPKRPNQKSDTLSLETLYAIAEENEPELQAMLYLQEAADVRLSIARQSYLPDLSFRYTYEDMKDGMHNTKYMFGLSVPLWFLDKQNKFVEEAGARVRQISARVENLRNNIRLSIKQARIKVDKYRNKVNLYENSVLPQAEAALKSALSAYQYNRLDFSVLLASEKTLVETEYDYEEACANLFIALAELRESVGFEE